jgi:hypothetical protein
MAQAEQDGDRRAATAQVAAAGQTLDASRQAEDAASEAYRLARIGYDAGRLPLSELLSRPPRPDRRARPCRRHQAGARQGARRPRPRPGPYSLRRSAVIARRYVIASAVALIAAAGLGYGARPVRRRPLRRARP